MEERKSRYRVQGLWRSVPTWQSGLQQARYYHFHAGTQGLASSQIRNTGVGGFILSTANDRLTGDNLTFHTVIINEAGTAMEPKVLNAITTRRKNLIRISLVGDVRQLRTIPSAHEIKRWEVDGQMHSG